MIKGASVTFQLYPNTLWRISYAFEKKQEKTHNIKSNITYLIDKITLLKVPYGLYPSVCPELNIQVYIENVTSNKYYLDFVQVYVHSDPGHVTEYSKIPSSYVMIPITGNQQHLQQSTVWQSTNLMHGCFTNRKSNSLFFICCFIRFLSSGDLSAYNKFICASQSIVLVHDLSFCFCLMLWS